MQMDKTIGQKVYIIPASLAPGRTIGDIVRQELINLRLHMVKEDVQLWLWSMLR